MIVRLIDANHCEGSCMFYYRIIDIDIQFKFFLKFSMLYTGDFRHCERISRDIEKLGIESLDVLYVDDECYSHDGYNTFLLEESADYMYYQIKEMERVIPNLKVFFAFHTMKIEDA